MNLSGDSEPARLGPGAGGETPRLAQSLRDADLMLEDRWILSRLNTVTRDVTDALEHYRFADAARTLYAFAWNDFCDYYVEMTKARFAVAEQRSVAQQVLAHVLDSLLRLLHPMLPFLTEEVWQLLNQVAPNREGGAEATAPDVSPSPSPSLRGRGISESVCIAAWPAVDAGRIDATIEEQFADFQAVLGAVRELRMGQNIPPREAVEFAVRCDQATAKLLEPMQPYFTQMAKAANTGWGPQVTPPDVAASAQVSGSRGPIEVHLDVSRFIDVDAERSRLAKQLESLRNHIKALETKLGNENFVSRAPAEVVEQQRAKLSETRGQVESVTAALSKLG